MTFVNNLDPDEAPQNVGLHLRSKLFDIQIIYQHKKWVETMDFLKILKETNIWNNYPACKELRLPFTITATCMYFSHNYFVIATAWDKLQCCRILLRYHIFRAVILQASILQDSMWLKFDCTEINQDSKSCNIS